MIEGLRILALIPARGGSKGIPGKNLADVAGKPLINWTIDCARAARYPDRILVSTDAPEIRACARRQGCDAPFLRPTELATDDADVVDTALHALDAVPESYDLLVLLQPTSPLRLPSDVDRGLELLAHSGADACVSTVVPDKSPYWCLRPNGGGLLAPLFPEHARTQRQHLPPAAIPNGAIYAIRVPALRAHRCFVTERTIGLPMPRERSIDIDDPLDLRLAETLLATAQPQHDRRRA